MGAGEPHLQPGLPSKEYRESRKAPSVGITTGDITHPPSWKAPPSPAPTVLSCSVEPSNAPLLTPTDTGPARPRSPQVPTPPGAPHPLSPHFPQKARGTRGYTHVQSPGAVLPRKQPHPCSSQPPAVGRAWLSLPNTLTCGHSTPLRLISWTAPSTAKVSRGPGISWVFLTYTYTHTPASAPETSSPAKVGIREEKRKIKMNSFQPCPLGR